MTRKHFVAIAQVIAETAGQREDQDIDNAVQELRIHIVNELADVFENDSPNFNRITFSTACKTPVRLHTGVRVIESRPLTDVEKADLEYDRDHCPKCGEPYDTKYQCCANFTCSG